MRQVFLILLIYLSQKNVSTIYAHTFHDPVEKYYPSKEKKIPDIRDCTSEPENSSDIEMRIVEGVILDANQMLPINGATIQVYNSLKELVATQKSDSDGNFRFQLFENDEYYLEYTQECYNQRYRKLEYINSHLPNYVKLYLDPIMDIEKVILPKKTLDLTHIPYIKSENGLILDVATVTFDLDDTTLTIDARKAVDEVADLMFNYPELQIEIGVYTSMGAQEEYNLQLTEERSLNIYKYLASKDLDIKRVTYKGYGSAKPIYFDYTKLDLSENNPNRRVEFKIIF